MKSKLNTGDEFPSMPLKLVDGSEVVLPADPRASYLVVLFYRGAF
ncbi:MAG: hypothetical protein ACRBC3_09415 [Burkholderiaceae bacterium]